MHGLFVNGYKKIEPTCKLCYTACTGKVLYGDYFDDCEVPVCHKIPDRSPHSCSCVAALR